jgi:hypothetical protein
MEVRKNNERRSKSTLTFDGEERDRAHVRYLGTLQAELIRASDG